VPAVLIGSFLSSRAPDRYIRPIITFVIFASGLKYIGVGTTALGWTLCAVALGGGAYWLVRTRPWVNGRPAAVMADGRGSDSADSRAGPPTGSVADSRAGPPGERRAS
jgi:hypothetical protein